MKQPDQKVIDIADFIYANPNKKLAEILRIFEEKYRKSSKSVERWYYLAKKYNKTRISKQEQAKEKAIIKVAQKQAERQAMTRDEAVRILEAIARGTAKNVPVKLEVDKSTGKNIPTKYEIIYPTYADQARVVQQLANMHGWDRETNSDEEKKDTTVIKLSDEREIEI